MKSIDFTRFRALIVATIVSFMIALAVLLLSQRGVTDGMQDAAGTGSEQD